MSSMSRPSATRFSVACAARLPGTRVADVPVLGADDVAPALVAEGIRHAFIGVGGAASTLRHRLLFDRARSQQLEVVTAVHPAAIISASAEVGVGATIMAGAIINAPAALGPNRIVNTRAIIQPA